jgi:hypothetical protein
MADLRPAPQKIDFHKVSATISQFLAFALIGLSSTAHLIVGTDNFNDGDNSLPTGRLDDLNEWFANLFFPRFE